MKQHAMIWAIGLAGMTWMGFGWAAGGPGLGASEVWGGHFEATGGRAAWERITTMRMRGRAQEGGETLEFELCFKAPGRLLFAGTVGGEVLVRMARDREGRCWRQDPRGVHELSEEPAGQLIGLVAGFCVPGQLHLSELSANASCERGKESDREVVTLRGREGGLSLPVLVFDAKTGRLIRIGDLSIHDYRAVGEFWIPFRAQAAQGKPAVFQVEEVKLGVELADGIFERPEGATAGRTRERVSVDGEGMPVLGDQLSRPGAFEVVRRPVVADFRRGRMLSLPEWQPDSARHFQVDLRGYDLTGLDLSGELNRLLDADYDSVTRWPELLPAGFNRAELMALGRDPGLGVRRLHEHGMDGGGVSIGIIDQPLLIEHVEYADRLRMYEEIHSPVDAPAQMHGPAVASIAVGRTVGVAPGAELYYIAEQHGIFRSGGGFDWDFRPLARSIDRLLEVNARLPVDRRIRVISISVGWSPSQKGYEEAMAAVRRADAAGVFVISTAIEATHGLAFHGLGRPVMADPNAFEDHETGSWWTGTFWGGQRRFTPGKRLLVPMDSRCVASPTGADHYVFYRNGGWSWSVPWIAGLYAIGCQVDPGLTPQVFWAKALETGRVIRVSRGGEECELGSLADPVVLMEALRR
jgi:hypothetical protein